jgi:hypothetical protein
LELLEKSYGYFNDLFWIGLTKVETKYLFLLGLMRSGTTFFRNVLSANSNIQALRSELNRFWTEVGQAPCGTVPNCLAKMREDATDSISNDVRNWFIKNYQAKNSPYNIIYRMYRIMRFGNETVFKHGSPFYMLNKSTHLNNKILFLDQIFPDAKFIYIVRDIYSHANSLYRHLLHLRKKGYNISYPINTKNECWRFLAEDQSKLKSHVINQKPFSFNDIPRYWLEQNIVALKSLEELSGDRLLFVKYEDVVKNLSDVIRRLSTFLQTDLNEDVNNKLINNYTLNPLTDWKSDLDKDQIDLISNMLSKNHKFFNFIDSFHSP